MASLRAAASRRGIWKRPQLCKKAPAFSARSLHLASSLSAVPFASQASGLLRVPCTLLLQKDPDAERRLTKLLIIK
jgi:hypothetical protein